MITRDFAKELEAAAKEFPVVTVFGPRQSGKTTLAQMTFPGKPYFSLKDPDTHLSAGTDPRGYRIAGEIGLPSCPDGLPDARVGRL